MSNGRKVAFVESISSNDSFFCQTENIKTNLWDLVQVSTFHLIFFLHEMLYFNKTQDYVLIHIF
jgi:hypothetical protein